MGFLQKLILGRWFTRWLLRGGPWAIAAKLAAVALFGAWKYRRERKRVERAAKAREIEATYEVLGDEGAPAQLTPRPEEGGRGPASGGTSSPMVG